MSLNVIKIIQAKPNDVKEIYQVRKTTWIETYPNKKFGITKKDILEKFIQIEKNFEKYLQERKEGLRKKSLKSCTWVAKKANQVIGFCSVMREEKRNKIGTIYVLPRFQGKGIGKKLMKRALSWLGKDKDVYVNVVSYNQKAINFYQSFGFVKTGKTIKEKVADLPCGKSLPEIEMVLKFSC